MMGEERQAVIRRKAEVGPSSTINLLLSNQQDCFVTLKSIFRVGTV